MTAPTSNGFVVRLTTLALSATLATAAAASAATVFVTNSKDAGAGSFRDAIAQANGNPAITRVQFLKHVSTVFLTSTVEFSGSQDLTIDGNRATLDGTGIGGDGPALLITGTASGSLGHLIVTHLTVRNAPGDGIAILVPVSATGVVRIGLHNVDVVNNAGHGVLINDQEDSSTPEEGIQPNANGSAASVDVSILGSRFIHNGYSVSDRDGLRVNEGGDGDLVISVKYSIAHDNGADGIECDERGAGDVRVEMSGTQLTWNGPFDPTDLDDGFDIDEYDAGSIVGTIVFSNANHNREEGFDFNENNLGDLSVNMYLVEARGNGEEGIDYEEDDDDELSNLGGNLITVMNGVATSDNGDGADGGLKIREKASGDLTVTLANILSVDNFGSGIFVRESSSGNALVEITRAVASRNKQSLLEPADILGHGFEMLESGGGELTATISNAIASANEGNGVFASDNSGTGVVTLTNVAFPVANGLGDTGGNLLP
jgi:hypothetical protein